MQRAIIRIDEELCNGCGQCVDACAEGAIQMVNGKARLVKEEYCDGLGDCIGECPTGALTIEHRKAAAFDPEAVEKHLHSMNNATTAKHMAQTSAPHKAEPDPKTFSGCPGMRQRVAAAPATNPATAVESTNLPGMAIPSELRQWPVQLHLVSPAAEYFNNRELLVLNSCAAVASADVHWRFLRGRSVVIACPKLDRTEGYIEKLASILQNITIPAVIIVRMEVPCCSGLTALVKKAVAQTSRTDLGVHEVVVDLNGEIRPNQS